MLVFFLCYNKVMKNYADFYQQITKALHHHPRSISLLRLTNQFLTRLMYLVYPLLLIYLFVRFRSIAALLPFLLIPGISFILLSLARQVINQPRPYERWSIEPLIPKNSSGKSMPSRHVFSATVISMCLLRVNTWLGLILLLFSALLALCRVIGGVHYPKDVIVGFLIGLVCGALLFL